MDNSTRDYDYVEFHGAPDQLTPQFRNQIPTWRGGHPRSPVREHGVRSTGMSAPLQTYLADRFGGTSERGDHFRRVWLDNKRKHDVLFPRVQSHREVHPLDRA